MERHEVARRYKPQSPIGGNVLAAVATISARDVWAVGYHDANGSLQTLTEHWNGSQWSIIGSPNVGSADSLYGVAAASTSDVWMADMQDLLTALHLYGVAAASTSDVWAVGTYGSGSTLTEQWNGTKWSIVKSPSPGTRGNTLNAVTALSASDAWAVGFYANTLYSTQSLAEYWNGSTWSLVPSANVVAHRPSRN